MFVSQKKKLDNSMMEEILGEECERGKILTSQKWQKCAPFLPLPPYYQILARRGGGRSLSKIKISPT